MRSESALHFFYPLSGFEYYYVLANSEACGKHEKKKNDYVILVSGIRRF